MRILAGAAACCAGLTLPAGARAAETVTIKASFTPDRLGVPANVFGSATIGSTDGPVPSPITHVNVMGPAGMTLDLEGTTTCSPLLLERTLEPTSCPAASRAGSGGGEGVYRIGNEIIHENFTLDFFLESNRRNHVVLLIFLSAYSPVSIQLLFKAPVVQEPKPYGLGFSVEVPLIKVLPEASNASAISSFLTLGAKNLFYFKQLHGRRTRLHVKGIILPRSCPRGGWPVASAFSFEDGSTVTARSKVPCPR
jgi:hypothetical protein